jgi:hypothetical protein
VPFCPITELWIRNAGNQHKNHSELQKVKESQEDIRSSRGIAKVR